MIDDEVSLGSEHPLLGIRPGAGHRMARLETMPKILIEVSTRSYLGKITH
jgi:hypothetical protein